MYTGKKNSHQRKPGRPKKAVAIQFAKFSSRFYEDGKKKVQISCTFCGNGCQSIVVPDDSPNKIPKMSRFAEHLLFCDKCPIETKWQVADDHRTKLVKRWAAENVRPDPSSNPASRKSTPKKVQKIDRFVRNYQLDKAKIEKINKSICRFIAVSGVPFSVVKMEPFKEMVRELNEAFIDGGHLRSDSSFRGNLLQQLYDDTKMEV